MSIDFTILCTSSPAAFLRKKAAWLKWNAKTKSGSFGGMALSLDAPADDDPLPDPSWQSRVVAVVRASGRLSDDTYDAFTLWTESLAETTRGAIYTPMEDEFSYVWTPDPTADTEVRVRALLASQNATELSKWVTQLARADEPSPSPSAIALGVVRRIAIPFIAERIAANDASWSAPLLTFEGQFFGDELQNLVIAASRLPRATKQLRRRATEILERREIDADREAELPTTTTQLRALMESAAKGDKSARRRYDRMVDEEPTRIVELVLAAAAEGWSPDAKTVQLALETADVEYLEAAQIATVLRADFATRGSVAKAIHAALVKWQAGHGQRAHAVTSSRIQMYEKYKSDPMVLAPRSRGMDVAMLRDLNDALWGTDRDRPMLPDDIVALVFDRRVDEARAAYEQRFPKATARVAAAAIDDAVAYFTPKTR